ncbi:MAG: TetR family transcriptional regulator, partial [Roseitalea sp.]|nr:TetR family transcriptional regulator [Roseitalea sp.]
MIVAGIGARKKVTADEVLAVLDAALEVARHDGLSAVTARSVAKRLGASTAPVTSYFDSMEALSRAVV